MYELSDINLIKEFPLYDLIISTERAIISIKPIETLAIHHSINRINDFHIKGHIDKNVNEFQNKIRDVERHIPKMISCSNKYDRKHFIDPWDQNDADLAGNPVFFYHPVVIRPDPAVVGI